MPTIELGLVASRGDGFRFAAPRFPAGCVCCGAEAYGRTQDYDPSTDRLQAESFPIPVCFDCRDHALATQLRSIMQASLMLVGACLVGLGVHYLRQRPQDHFLWAVIGVGGAMLVGALASIGSWSRTVRRAVSHQRRRDDRGAAGREPRRFRGGTDDRATEDHG